MFKGQLDTGVGINLGANKRKDSSKEKIPEVELIWDSVEYTNFLFRLIFSTSKVGYVPLYCSCNSGGLTTQIRLGFVDMDSKFLWVKKNTAESLSTQYR